jgi:terminase, large subunit
MQLASLEHLKKTWFESWDLPAQLNPWQWAEANIEFSTRISPLPGKYSTTSTPYVREVLEAAADPKVRHITLCWSAQSSKTTTAMMILLYSIANDPGNALLVRPSLQAAQSLSENKLMVAIDENPCLASQKTNNKDDYKKTAIKLKNMVIFVRGASPNQLSAESCKTAILDECDKYELYREDKAEADLISLAYERTKFYKNHLKVDTSTPTVPSGSIWQLYNEGDQRQYFMPCIHCGAEFAFKMKYFKFDSNNPKKTACFQCPHCSEIIQEKHKTKMMLAGRWVAQNPNDGEHRSYQLPEFYSPVTRWGELADKFVKATHKAKFGDFGQLHNFINSSLAEPWEPSENSKREVEQIEALQDQREKGTVPPEAIGLTIGIDTQDLYFEYVVRAWGRDSMDSWLIDHGRADTAEALINILSSEYPCTDGKKSYKITAGLMDSGGHRTSEVYDFCRNNRRFRLRPSKGERTLRRPWEVSKVDTKPNGTPLPGGVKLVRVNTTYYKDLLAGKLSLTIDEQGAFRLHANTDLDYISHMTAEYRDSKGVWQCPSGKRNESWDCEVLNTTCADMLGYRFVAARQHSQKQHTEQRTEQPRDNDEGQANNSIQPKKVLNKKPKRIVSKRPNPYTEGIG